MQIAMHHSLVFRDFRPLEGFPFHIRTDARVASGEIQ